MHSTQKHTEYTVYSRRSWMMKSQYLPVPSAVTVSTICCSTRDRAAAPAHTPIISAAARDTPQKKPRFWREKRKVLLWSNKCVAGWSPTEWRTSPDLEAEYPQRWVVIFLARGKAKGSVLLCYCLERAQSRNCFTSLGECPPFYGRLIKW